MNWITAIGRVFRRGPAQSGAVLADRLLSYQAWDAYYHNRIYEPVAGGGQRENILAALGNAAAADLAGLYNPVARVVDLYQHVLGGEFGVDIQAVPGDNAGQIRDPLRRIWRWSNINQAKQLLCRIAPTHGNCGLRVVVRNAEDPARRRVFLKPEHPATIRDVELDERGNVAEILLEYTLTTGLDDARAVVTIRELQTRERFQTWRVEHNQLTPFDTFAMRDNGPGAVVDNTLGLVPYVLLAHSPSGETWSMNAFHRALPLLDRLNALQTHINVQIHRHVKAKLAVASSGQPPREFDLTDMTVAHFNTAGGSTPPVFEWLVAPLNLADAITEVRQLIEQVEDELPELKATAGHFLSGQSGETIMQLRQPAEHRLALARINYEDALIRAQQIALSFGVLHELWDLGTGMGTVDAAERAYTDGYEDHVFNNRALLPVTAMERLRLLEQQQAAGLSRARALRDYGMSADAVAENEIELASQQQQATDAFTRAFDRA